jgi:1,2-diacylglycerol 3-alpha-glucosyltransferase
MRIGYFTDTYFPRSDGVVHSIELLRHELELMGHEVYVIAPLPTVQGRDDPYTIRLFGFRSPVDGHTIAVFSPRRAYDVIKTLQLDIVHVHDPAPIGWLGTYVASRIGVPLVGTWHTDYFEYVRYYPAAFPAMLLFSLLAPLLFRGNAEECRVALRMAKPELSVTAWSRKIVQSMGTAFNNRCDVVIAPCARIKAMLNSWGLRSRIEVLPTGVDKLHCDEKYVEGLRRALQIAPGDPIIMYAGRLGKEKNLELLLSAFVLVLDRLPKARLLLVGEHSKQSQLIRRASRLGIGANVLFAGHVDRSQLGALYELASVFAFPSLTDTQGLSVHEAAHAGLPIVIVDDQITEVVRDGENGFRSRVDHRDLAQKLVHILRDDRLRETMSIASRKRARILTARGQATKLLHLYEEFSTKPKVAASERIR